VVDAGEHDPHHDAALVARAVAGEPAAFGQIFDRYAPRIHAYCTRMLGEPHTAADATQDTFVAAARRMGQLRDPSKLRPWLYAIARNECTRHGRARDRAVPTEDHAMTGLDDATGDEPARAAEAGEVGELLWEAAAGLDDRDRTLLELQVRHGLEGRELALAAGLPEGQISMATGRLRDRLERAVGALLVARHGRTDCAALQQVLADWDGTFSVLWRKRVARHVDGCTVCEGRRAALVAPLGSLAVTPAALVAFDALPPGLRDRTVDAMTESAASGTDGLEPWGEDGFPLVPEDGDVDPEDAAGDGADPAEPPLPTGAGPANAPAMAGDERRGRRAFVVLAIAVVLLLAAGAGLVLATDEGAPTAAPTSAAPGDEGDAPTDDAATTTEVRSGSTATSPPLSDATDPDDAGATATTDPDLTDAPPATTPPATGAPTTTVVAAPAPAPTTVPNAPPTIGTPVRSGSATMQTTCNPANDTRTISVAATDDRGIDRVVLRWTHSVLGAGERTMVRSSGGTWQATLGPFAEPGTVTFRAVAVDTDGASTASGTSSVAIDPCPG
jgi:RNA polymerase sigma factor (sigma-70 family)